MARGGLRGRAPLWSDARLRGHALAQDRATRGCLRTICRCRWVHASCWRHAPGRDTRSRLDQVARGTVLRARRGDRSVLCRGCDQADVLGKNHLLGHLPRGECRWLARSSALRAHGFHRWATDRRSGRAATAVRAAAWLSPLRVDSRRKGNAGKPTLPPASVKGPPADKRAESTYRVRPPISFRTFDRPWEPDWELTVAQAAARGASRLIRARDRTAVASKGAG